MSVKFIAAAFFVLTGAFAYEASAVGLKSPAPRSAIQNECISENPNDHQAYLACIQRKKAEQKNSAATSAPSVKSDALPPAANTDGKNQ